MASVRVRRAGLTAAISLAVVACTAASASAAATPRGPWGAVFASGARLNISAVPAGARSIPRIEVGANTGGFCSSGGGQIVVTGARENVALVPGDRFDALAFPVRADLPDGGTVTGSATVSGTIGTDGSLIGALRVSWNDYSSPSCTVSGRLREEAFNFPGTGPPPPQEGRAVNVAVTRGTVRIRRRGSRRFVVLRGSAQIPVGSEVDTKRGAVALTSATPNGPQQAEFFDGRFIVRQRRGQGGLTDLALSEPLVCARAGASTLGRAAARRRRLWGRGRGRFRTRGRHAAAVVRGTTWLTEDRCDSTLVRVRVGVVAVRDFVRNRTVLVRAGRSYTARR